MCYTVFYVIFRNLDPLKIDVFSVIRVSWVNNKY